MWRTITGGRVWHGEFHNRRKDGSTYWEDAVISPVKDEAGRVVNMSHEIRTPMNAILGFTELSLRRTLDHVVSLHEPVAVEKGLYFLSLSADDLPSVVYGDELRLNQIIINMGATQSSLPKTAE